MRRSKRKLAPPPVPTAHKQVFLRVGRNAAYVDHGIAGLIAALWHLGIGTRASCQSFRREGTVWIAFRNGRAATTFKGVGQDCMLWPTVLTWRITARDLAEAGARTPDDPKVGTRVYSVLIPRGFAAVVKAHLVAKVAALAGAAR